MIVDLNPKRGWMLLYGAAFAASFCPLVVQLLFASVAIGVVGMAHGASDLAVVPPEKRVGFLCGYVSIMTVCLLGWQHFPTSALPGFLVASAIHFTLEEPTQSGWLTRVALGIGLVTIPAVFYRNDTAELLSYAGFSPTALGLTMNLLQGTGALCAGGLICLMLFTQQYRRFTGVVALLFFPPLVGFSVGFLILHAFPQTDERCTALGCRNYYDYLQVTWPILVGALLFTFAAIFFLLPSAQNSVRNLFTLLTALALPHLLVTPLFERKRMF